MIFQRLIYQSILWRGIYFVSVIGLNIMIARYYKAADSGLIYFITNNLALVVIMGSFSLESAIAYYVASKKIDRIRLGNLALLWAVITTLLVYVVLNVLLFSGLIPSFYRQHSFISVFYVGGCILTNLFLGIYYAEKNFLLPNIIMTLVNFLLIILALTGNKWFDQDQYINIYFSSFLIQGVLIAASFVIRSRKTWTIIFPSAYGVFQLFRYASQAFGASILFFLLYRIDYWFVEKYCSANDLGNYIQVSKLVQIFIVLPGILASVIFPLSAEGGKESAKKAILFLSRVIIFFYSLISILLIATGYWLFPFMYGSSFGNMYVPYLLLIPGIFFLSILNLLGAYFAGQNKVRLNLICSGLGLVVIVVGDIIFIPAQGIAAAAFISSLGYFVCVAFLIRMFIRQHGCDIKEMLILQKSDIQGIKTWLTKNLLN